MEKTYKYDSRKKAQQWAVGNGTWFDGHERGNLYIVSATSPVTSHYDGGYMVDVTFRPATEAEFIPARLRWLTNRRSEALTNCRYGMADAGSLELECRAEVAAINAEMAELKAVA